MKNGEWIKEFTPIEKAVSSDITLVVNSAEWLVYGFCGLGSLAMFVIAGSRSRNGDTLGACLASIGAVVSAIAPIVAKSFTIGG